MDKYILGIDLGSSSTKVGIFDSKGKLIKFLSKKLDIFIYDKINVEHCPKQIINDLKELIDKLLEDFDYKKILGIGLTNQRETIVAWNKKTGNPIYNAISWQDNRTDDLLKDYFPFEQKIKDKTGLKISSYFSAAKIVWILKNTKYLSSEIQIGTIDSWVIWNLTNKSVFATDFTNASRTLLMNIHELKWDNELLSIFNISIEFLPNIHDSNANFGSFIYKGHEIPIVAVLGDQQSALFSTLFVEGNKKISDKNVITTLGTGAFIMANTNENIVKHNNLLTTIFYKLKDQVPNYAIEYSIFNCGNLINWLLQIGAIKDLEIDEDFEMKNNFFIIPNHEKKKSKIIGFDYSINEKDFLSASLFSISCFIFEAFEKIKELIKIDKVFVNGKISKNLFLASKIKNLSDLNIYISKIEELTIFGIVYLAGVSLGFWNLSESLNLRSNFFIPKKNNKFTSDKDFFNCWNKNF